MFCTLCRYCDLVWLITTKPLSVSPDVSPIGQFAESNNGMKVPSRMLSGPYVAARIPDTARSGCCRRWRTVHQCT